MNNVEQIVTKVSEHFSETEICQMFDDQILEYVSRGEHDMDEDFDPFEAYQEEGREEAENDVLSALVDQAIDFLGLSDISDDEIMQAKKELAETYFALNGYLKF